MALEKELETYGRELPRLLREHAGKFVLVHGDEVAGVFDTDEEAVEAGDERFGLEAFLVQRVQEKDPVRFIPFDVKPLCPT